MIKFLVLIAILLSNSILAQSLHKISGMPDGYSATIYKQHFLDKDSLYIDGYVSVKDKKNNQIIKSRFTDLDYSFEGKNTLPFSNQDFIVIKDFNFDGLNDFAIKNGSKGCYGGPSYSIFIQKKHSFYKNHYLSVLTEEYCGLFEVDYTKKELVAYYKSGYAFHSKIFIKVEDDRPVITKMEFEDATYLPFISKTIVEKINGKEFKYRHITIDKNKDLYTEILKFTTNNANEDKVIVFTYGDTLYYAYLYKNGEVSEYFPNLNIGNFIYFPKQNKLVFKFDNYLYEIVESKNKTDKKAEIRVRSDITVTKSKPNTVFGSLSKLKKIHLQNLSVQ